MDNLLRYEFDPSWSNVFPYRHLKGRLTAPELRVTPIYVRFVAHLTLLRSHLSLLKSMFILLLIPIPALQSLILVPKYYRRNDFRESYTSIKSMSHLPRSMVFILPQPPLRSVILCRHLILTKIPHLGLPLPMGIVPIQMKVFSHVHNV